MSPSGERPLRIFWIWLLCWSGVLFSGEENEKPFLLRAETSLPWAVEGIQPELGSRFKSLLLASLSNTGDPVMRARSRVLAHVEGRPRLGLSEPGNPLLPIPEVVLWLPSQNPEKLMPDLEYWLKMEIESWLGVPAPWLKFNPTAGRKKVWEAFVMAGRIWLLVKEGGCELLFSSRFGFLDEHLGRKLVHSPKAKDEKPELEFHVGRVLKVYLPWWKSIRGKDSLDEMEETLSKVEKIDVDLSGSGKEMTLTTRVNTKEKQPLVWHKPSLFPRLQGKTFFQGGVTLFEGLDESLLDLIPEEAWGAEPEVAGLAKIFLRHLESFAFAQSRSAVAPVFSLRIKNLDELKTDLGKWALQGKGRCGIDPQTKEIHLQWGKTTLSLREEKGHLLFSPLRQVLEDSVMGLEVAKSQKRMWFELPLKGTIQQNYYAAFMAGLAMSEYWKGPVDPNLIPSFSMAKLEKGSWEKSLRISLKKSAGVWGLSMDLPYGPLGLISGLELQTSTLVYVLSWTNLSRNSWKGR